MDRQIGRNVAAFRDERSQKEVAEAMRQLGWKWSQATLWAIEKGERPLRLAEAKDLAQVLGAQSQNFLESDENALVDRAMARLNLTGDDLDRAIDTYTDALFELAIAVDDSAEPSAAALDYLVSQTPVALAKRAGKFRTGQYGSPNVSSAAALADRLRAGE